MSSYLEDNELHLEVKMEIDKDLIKVVKRKGKFIAQETSLHFDAVAQTLANKSKNYLTVKGENDTHDIFIFDMYIFSKDELENYLQWWRANYVDAI